MAPPDTGQGEHASNVSSVRGNRALRVTRPDRAGAAPQVLDRPHGNLPLELTSFVGRENEIAEIRQRLGETRLLTLTGPGGSGKTRLALEVAAEVAGRFEDGAWWVALASLSDPELLSQAVAEVLGIRGESARPLSETLEDRLRSEQALLILDNCEHLVDACALLVDALLHACPNLRVLATSREVLAVAGETPYPVPPLSLPDLDDPVLYGELARYEAIRLFVERARTAAPSFELTEHNASAVAQVCEKLEGLPLAVELAAAKVRVLTVDQIASRLEAGLELLKTESRTTDPRQRTLRAAINWSHELLSENERIVFRRLAVFSGGFELEAAEQVCAGAGVPEGEVLDLLTRLVDKSLMLVEKRQDGKAARYRLLETIRRYGTEKLEDSGEESEVLQRHARFFLTLSEELERAMWGAEEAAWLSRLEAELGNLRAALSWALECDVELGLRLAGALRWFWYWRGNYGEGRGWLDEALTKRGRAPVARAKALHAVGWLAHDQGDMDRAEAAAEEGIEVCRTAGIEGSLAATFRNLLGEAARHRGDYRRATALLEKGAEIYREAGDRRGIAWSLFLLGNTSSLRGDHQRATTLYEEGLALSRQLGGAQPLGDCLAHLGYERLLEGDYEQAVTLSEEAAALLRGQRYRGGLQFVLNNLGWVALVQGEHERASALHRESLLLCRELGDRLIASESIEGLACADRAQENAERAARMFGSAQALRETVGQGQAPRGSALLKPRLEDVRAKLDAATWDAAFAEGRKMTFAEATEYALETEEEVQSASLALPNPGGLSVREAEVLKLVARGLTNARVAQELYISPRTVDRHLNSVYRKLGVSSRVAAARFAAENGLT